MDRYYFKTTGALRSTCIENCMVKDDGTMIGSVKCQECEHCVDHQKPNKYTGGVDWIKCSKLEAAKPKDVTK